MFHFFFLFLCLPYLFALYFNFLEFSLSPSLEGFCLFRIQFFFQKSFSDLNQSLIAEECAKAQEIISPPKKPRAELPNELPNDQPIVSPSWYTIVLNLRERI